MPEGTLGNYWSRKSGGARIIYFLNSDETVWLLIVYKKAKFDDLPTAFIAQLRKAVQDAL
jgi:mRNA-degrading endonuclease RelE of RelBE toxin-antitoxin system